LETDRHPVKIRRKIVETGFKIAHDGLSKIFLYGGATMEDKTTKSLVDFLEYFLVKIFGKEFIESEYGKLKTYVPKGKPEELRYLITPNVHRVGRWYNLLHIIKEREYSFDLRFSTDIEEFMRLLLFVYGFDLLVRNGILPLAEKKVTGALRDRDRFDSLIYETIIASNYVSNKFNVKFPELFGERVEFYAEKYFAEAKEYVGKGDSVQASEKMYKVVEECIKALAQHYNMLEHEVAVKEGRWWTQLLGKAARGLSRTLNEPRITDVWARAYDIHVWGFH
jgi:hypothetical protein